MGAIENAVQTIYANVSLSPAQKRAQAAQTRATAINNLLAGHLPFTFTQGVWSVTVTAAAVAATVYGYGITVTVSVTKSGVPRTIDNPLVFVNPPVLVDDPAGTIVRTAALPPYAGGATVTRTLTEDVAGALKQTVVAELVRQLGA